MRSEQGSAVVETAVSMVCLLTLIFAVFEVSIAVYSYHFVANAAHEGARYAIVRGSGWGAACSSPSSSMCTASTAQIAAFVASRQFPGVNLTANDVCVQYSASVSSTPSTTCTANTTPNSAGDLVQVTVTYPFTFNLPFVKALKINLASTSQMTIAQ
jgi:Flp pilus assembly protein TadG